MRNSQFLFFIRNFMVLVVTLLSSPCFAQASSDVLLREGYAPWSFGSSDCQACEIAFVTVRPELQDRQVQAFIQALSAHKMDLQILYRIDGQEYNLLAHMAIGILGRESHFFHSHRYQMKENLQWAVRILKVMKVYLAGDKARPSANSRGPTQIKIVPDKIEKFYGLQESELFIPENAALKGNARAKYLCSRYEEIHGLG